MILINESRELVLSFVTRKPVFGVTDQVRLKPTCVATVARLRLGISDIETRGFILSRQRTTKALIRPRILICAFVVRIWQRLVFARRGSIALSLPEEDTFQTKEKFSMNTV